MKKVFIIALLLLFVHILPSTIYAQEDEVIDDTPESEQNDIILTPSGSAFQNGSADGQCTVAGNSCTTQGNAPGVCVDNGDGAGVCSNAVPSIDPLFDTGCAPTDKCHIRGEKISAEIQGGQTETRSYHKDPLGLVMNYIQEWFGEEKPDNAAYHYVRDLMKKFGYALKDSARDLTSDSLQKMTVHDTNQKPFCTTARLCVYNPWSDELMYQFITEETWCTDDPPGRKEGIEGTRDLAAMTTRYEVSPYKLLPVTLVKKISPLPCGRKLEEGEYLDMDGLNFIKTNLWSTADKISTWTVTVVQALISGPTCTTNEDTGKEDCVWGVSVPTNAVLKTTSENGMAASWAGISFTVTDKDLEPFAYPMTDQARKDLTRGGLWDTWRNNAYDVEFKSKTDAIYKNQPWFVSIPGFGNKEADTLQAMNARQEEAQTFGYCSITSDQMQSKTLGSECDKNWVSTPSPSESGIASSPPSVPDTSTWSSTPGGTSANAITPGFTAPSPITAGNATSLVPACVLEGVAKIEGAYDGNAPCKPNECGAYGPFQITTGNCKPSCGASSCPNAAAALGVTKDDLCDFNSAAYQAARLLVGKANYFGYKLTNADPKTQKNAIIIAGDSYYGVTSPIARLGGLSYGEWVYAHCDPSYTKHVDHSFPAQGAGTQF